jgi:hypothetical protein
MLTTLFSVQFYLLYWTIWKVLLLLSRATPVGSQYQRYRCSLTIVCLATVVCPEQLSARSNAEYIVPVLNLIVHLYRVCTRDVIVTSFVSELRSFLSDSKSWIVLLHSKCSNEFFRLVWLNDIQIPTLGIVCSFIQWQVTTWTVRSRSIVASDKSLPERSGLGWLLRLFAYLLLTRRLSW